MSKKNKDFDPLSALFRDLSESEEDVPEPFRFMSSDESAEETTTVIIPVKSEADFEEDSDEDLVEPLSLKQKAPVFQSPLDPDETEHVPVTKYFPPKPAHTLVSPDQKSDIARSLIESVLQNQTVPEDVELPHIIPDERLESASSSKQPKSSRKTALKSEGMARWNNFKRPKSALQMALEIAAEEFQQAKQESNEHSELMVKPIENSLAIETDTANSVDNSNNQTSACKGSEALSDVNVLLTEHISSLLHPVFPNLAHFSVVRAIYADDRPLLESLWKSHRNKFILEGRLEYAISTLSVIHALRTAPHNDLVAAHMETDASDYLVWIRPSNGDVLAAFQDARRYFAD